ncbi:DUF2690 domain-containing protein [Nocardia higoensis]|uniref:DUF2690 domain-containing protein n=1 Tax=Nocardia higoensis TaxID=228599 RepID=A0ABS0D6L3_9NOCA|nr:DUF2690 domain-containing protein [Nocardia higoensis]MBF6354126.1 DUF2690 domain-containing protein [Nocardia higoensis]
MGTLRTVRRVLVAMTATLGLAFGATIAVSGTATAEPVNCYGDYCSGQDPRTSGCGADAYTTVTTETEVGRLDVRWSPTCKTNWARWVRYPRGWTMSQIPMVMRAVQDTGYEQVFVFQDGIGGDSYPDHPEWTTFWTPMIYSPVHKVRAEMQFQCTGVGDCLISGVEGPLVTAWS